MITEELFQYLKDLGENNNRDWFNENKPTYQKHLQTVKSLFQTVQDELSQTDQIEGHKIYRIYRDVRFSKDKSPYKKHFSGYFSRVKPMLRGGYYLHLEPGDKSIVGGGFYGPNSDDLKRIREELSYDATELRDIIEAPSFKEMFGEMYGEELKSAPRGFDKNDPAIDLIRKKQFIFFRTFKDEEVTAPDFSEKIMKGFIEIRPFFDYMSNVLTTDSNGEPLF
ncbi:DUF2461 domain-containing protein [Flammeovirga sp. EKP202]|uniref:DUF2461 domain-containing protein n=1 Tax=Flammeovirga sp. EKP202 TaxID=2770592 RepID=UPI00165FD884|nr:DUF2461 domain-containing protein [Flammeovirga sp. EKP202]MBD0402854.1 DUF2461 domain-containing protein [Flammeovirga sp. EKP202]